MSPEQRCPRCGSGLIVKHGRNGKFLSCDRWPNCSGSLDLPVTRPQARKPEPNPVPPVAILVPPAPPPPPITVHVELPAKQPPPEEKPAKKPPTYVKRLIYPV